MAEIREKQVGKRKSWNPSLGEADRWQKTVQQLRGEIGVCKRGLYKFKTFEEADQWMEAMIVSSIRKFQP